MNLSYQLKNILPLTIILLGLISYNFMSAQWVTPTGSPPNNNAQAPINVGTSTQSLQAGNGSLVFNTFAAGSQMRSDSYCNSIGSDCIKYSDINNLIITSYTQKNIQVVGKGQKVSVSCSESTQPPINGLSNHEVLTGGGCRVTGTYDELATDEGNVFSYPILGAVNIPRSWNCENKNLATTTIEASAVCLAIVTSNPGLE